MGVYMVIGYWVYNVVHRVFVVCCMQMHVKDNVCKYCIVKTQFYCTWNFHYCHTLCFIFWAHVPSWRKESKLWDKRILCLCFLWVLKPLTDIKFGMNVVVLEVASSSRFWNMTLNSLVRKCTCIFFGLTTGKPLKQIVMYNESFSLTTGKPLCM